MRRLSIKKILIFSLVVVYSSMLGGCDVTKVDKNKNSYLTTPYDVIPVTTEEDEE